MGGSAGGRALCRICGGGGGHSKEQTCCERVLGGLRLCGCCWLRDGMCACSSRSPRGTRATPAACAGITPACGLARRTAPAEGACPQCPGSPEAADGSRPRHRRRSGLRCCWRRARLLARPHWRPSRWALQGSRCRGSGRGWPVRMQGAAAVPRLANFSCAAHRFRVAAAGRCVGAIHCALIDRTACDPAGATGTGASSPACWHTSGTRLRNWDAVHAVRAAQAAAVRRPLRLGPRLAALGP